MKASNCVGDHTISIEQRSSPHQHLYKFTTISRFSFALTWLVSKITIISDHCLTMWCPLLTACPPPGPLRVEAPRPCARRGWVRGPRPRCCSTAWGRWPPGPGWCAARSAAPPRCRSQGGWAALKHRKCISTFWSKSKWPSLNCWINFHNCSPTSLSLILVFLVGETS